MKSLFLNKKIGSIIIVITSLLLFFIFLGKSVNYNVYNVKAKSLDNEILLKWDNPKLVSNIITIDIYYKETFVERIKLTNNETSYSFKEGDHGKKYTFKIYEKNAKEPEIVSSMFIDKNKISDIPTIYINTEGEQLPSYETVYAPEGLWGASMINNEYIKASFVLENKNTTITKQDIEIRNRGNTSGIGVLPQYKIKLQNKEDLFKRGNTKYEDDEYLLISKKPETTLKWIIGMELSKCLGMEWTPRYEPVNLFINDEYVGCYLLIENVKKSTGRIDISNNGYIIENDAYFWKTDNYFKTNYQISQMGFTYKFPNKNSEEREKELREYINMFEEYLYCNDERYKDFIDEESFAKWLLMNDVLYTWDAGGTNQYIMIKEFDKKVMQIPCFWDYDSAFYEQLSQEWSGTHGSNVLYFNQLLKQQQFRKKYVYVWDKYKNAIKELVVKKTNNSKINASQESMNLMCENYDFEKLNLIDSYNEYKVLIAERIDWLDNAISDYRD